MFTAYLLEQSPSFVARDMEHKDNPVRPNWYPSIYFFDLDSQRVSWEIYGAEQFISIEKNVVMFLANDIWKKMDGKTFKKLGSEKTFSRHQDYYSYVRKMKFGTTCVDEDLEQVNV